MSTEVPNSDPSPLSLPSLTSVPNTLVLLLQDRIHHSLTADTSEVMCDLTGEGSEGLQDCWKSMFSPVNDASGLLESGRGAPVAVDGQGGTCGVCSPIGSVPRHL